MICHYFNFDQNKLLVEAKERLERSKGAKPSTVKGVRALRISRKNDEILVKEKEAKKSLAKKSPRVINFISYLEETLIKEEYGEDTAKTLLNKGVYDLTLNELEKVYYAIVSLRLDGGDYSDNGEDTLIFKVAYNFLKSRAVLLGLPLRKTKIS